MDLTELISSLSGPLNVIAGAFATLLGMVIQTRMTGAQAKSKLRLEKLERAYSLCQLVYDGHLREIKNFKSYRQSQPSDFLKNRKHPGAEMSELKMLVRCYVPEMSSEIERLDNGHGPLKRMFEKFENEVRGHGNDASVSFVSDCLKVEEFLVVLGEASTGLKLKLASATIQYTK